MMCGSKGAHKKSKDTLTCRQYLYFFWYPSLVRISTSHHRQKNSWTQNNGSLSKTVSSYSENKVHPDNKKWMRISRYPDPAKMSSSCQEKIWDTEQMLVVKNIRSCAENGGQLSDKKWQFFVRWSSHVDGGKWSILDEWPSDTYILTMVSS